MAERKTLRGNYTIWAAVPEALDDWENISAADFNAAIADGLAWDISCAVTDDSGDSLNLTDSETDDSQSICDISSVETPTFFTYAAELDGFRNAPGTVDTPYYETFFNLFNGVDRKYYLIKRVDKQQGTPLEAGDITSQFEFTTDYGVDIVEDNSMALFGARFKPTGNLATNRDVVA